MSSILEVRFRTSSRDYQMIVMLVAAVLGYVAASPLHQKSFAIKLSVGLAVAFCAVVVSVLLENAAMPNGGSLTAYSTALKVFGAMFLGSILFRRKT